MDHIISKINKILKFPSDIDKKLDRIIIETEEKIKNDKIKYRRKIEKGINNITTNYSDIKKIRDNYKNFTEFIIEIDELQNKFTHFIKDYDKIKMISIAHMNFERIIEFYENLVKYSDSDILKEKEDPDLWNQYLKFLEYDDFRLQLKFYMDDVDKDTYLGLQETLNNLDMLCLRMEKKILDISKNYSTELITNLEIILKIVENENKRDDIAMKCKNNEKSSHDRVIYKLHREFIKREIVDIQKKISNTIIESIQKKFKNISQSEFYIDNLDFVFDELDSLQKLSKISFLSFIFYEYHSTLQNLLEENKKNLDAGEILSLLEFNRRYKNVLEGMNRFDILNKPLIEKEDEYLKKYVSIISEKLNIWIENILNSELEKFKNRDVEPDEDEDKKFISTGFINLLQIIKEQLEPVSFDKNIFKMVTKMIITNVEHFKNEINKAMEADLKPSYRLKSKPAYDEYVITIGNSGFKLTQYTSSLPQCQNVEVKALGNIFIEILKKSNYCLSVFILKTCKPVIENLFTDAWYNENITRRLIVTFDDFLYDYKITMTEYSFLTFIYDLSAKLLDSYIKQLGKSQAKILDSFSMNLERDYKMIKDILMKYTEEDIESVINPLIKIIPLVDAQSIDLFLVELKAFKLSYPDLKKEFVKNVIKKRNDLNADEKRLWIDKIKTIFDE